LISTPPQTSRALSLSVLVVTTIYLMVVRTWGITRTFYLLRDQIRDWRLALGPFAELPLTGPQSTAGGSSLGPIYYWVLWASRVIIGPFTSNLPHAGAIGIALLQTGADLLLLHALTKRLGSIWLALATVLFTATAAHDLAITATIWNPAVSIAFVKVAIALVLTAGDRPSFWRMSLTTIAAWLAVQAHSSAIFAAVPILAWFFLRDLPRTDGQPFQRLRTMIELVLVLQLPYIYHLLTHPDAAPTRALGGVSEALKNPETYRLVPSARALEVFTGRILFAPLPIGLSWSIALVLVAAAALVRARRDYALLSVSVIPLLMAVLGFAVWQGNYDEYWYLPLAPAVAVMVALVLSLVPRREVGMVALAAVLLLQPWRIHYAQLIYRMPQYRALAQGSRAIMRQTSEVRRLYTSFPIPPFGDAEFLYQVLGGRISDSALFDATIDETGHVRFAPVRR
jgi:hypothetical protein